MGVKIQRTITTKHSSEEVQNFINEKFLGRKEVNALLSAQQWKGNTLYVESKLFSGVLAVEEGSLTVDLELTLFGSAAKTKIVETIDKGLLMLSAPPKEQSREEGK